MKEDLFWWCWGFLSELEENLRLWLVKRCRIIRMSLKYVVWKWKPPGKEMNTEELKRILLKDHTTEFQLTCFDQEGGILHGSAKPSIHL